jgi:hypothetical protein
MSSAPRVALREAYERCSIMDAPLAERLAAYSGAVREHFPAYAKAVDELVVRLRGSSAGENAPHHAECATVPRDMPTPCHHWLL